MFVVLWYLWCLQLCFCCLYLWYISMLIYVYGIYVIYVYFYVYGVYLCLRCLCLGRLFMFMVFIYGYGIHIYVTLWYLCLTVGHGVSRGDGCRHLYLDSYIIRFMIFCALCVRFIS